MTFQKTKIELLFQELSYKIVGCAFKVHNELGGGHLEKSYHNALTIALSDAGLQFISKQHLAVSYSGKFINGYEPDLLVEDSVIVEIKRRCRLNPKDFDQARRYLKLTGKKLALLIHFGTDSVSIKRVVNLDSDKIL